MNQLLQQIKDEVANELGYEDFADMTLKIPFLVRQMNFYEEVVERHAKAYAMECLKRAAHRCNYPYRDEFGCICDVSSIITSENNLV